jgi:hypothetical protein
MRDQLLHHNNKVHPEQTDATAEEKEVMKRMRRQRITVNGRRITHTSRTNNREQGITETCVCKPEAERIHQMKSHGRISYSRI